MTWTTLPRSDFGALSAISKGSGRLVLLIHGVGLQSEAWRRQIEALAPTYRAVAVDLPGHGKSAMPAGQLSVADYTNLIAAGLEEPALVVGHSMGAMIALDMASRYPQKLRGVAGLNAIFERNAEAAQAVKSRAASLDGVTLADPTQTLDRWFGAVGSPERNACRDWLTAVDPEAYKTAYSAFADDNGPRRDALDALACPALFMTGALEPNSTPEMSRTMAALAPKGRAIIVDGAAHMMPMTHARPVNAALLDFAQEVWA